MGISLNPQHLKRYRQIAWIFVKYGRSDLVQTSGLGETLTAAEQIPPEQAAKADELATDLEQLGPTFVKIGQLLSTRVELLPPAYLDALARLQDKVEPFSFAEVEKIVSEELGVRLSKAFQNFEDQPMAAASLGQVHRATLRDGRAVAVKVQRPQIRERMVEDFEALENIADFLDHHTEMGKRYEFCQLLAQFRKSLLQELDYRQEANNLTTLREQLREFPRLIVPAPIADYCTSRVLTMEFVAGKKSPTSARSLGWNSTVLPSPRKCFTPISSKFWSTASSMPTRTRATSSSPPTTASRCSISVWSAGSCRDCRRTCSSSSSPSQKAGATKPPMWRSRSARKKRTSTQRNSPAGSAKSSPSSRAPRSRKCRSAGSFFRSPRARPESGIRVPPELSMLGKTLLNLDQVGRAIAPDFDPNASIRRNAGEIMQQRLVRGLSPGNLFSGVLELKDLLQRLPARINRILDSVANNELKVTVDAIDENTLIEGFQKVANRITMGLILAALIVGTAMLMRVETSFRIWGYPGLAILLFLAAVGSGIALLINILFYDKSGRP